ncbi:MAG: glycosyltransferase family 4 protein [Anaerolineae bacterium]|nr:glycosyltransferase family 4 protein [Anaerolineae bacterium]
MAQVDVLPARQQLSVADEAKTHMSRAAMRFHGVRMVGLSTYSILFDRYRYTGKGADLFNNLWNHFKLVDLGVMEVKGWHKWYHRMMYFHPKRSVWSTAARMNVLAFKEHTRQAEEFLKSKHGQYDLIFQLHTMMSPGFKPGSRPYVMATDNTYIQSERYWNSWVPVKRDRNQWVDMETEVYQNALTIFSWSEFTRQSLINDYGIAPEKVVVTGSSGNFKVDENPKDDFSHPIALFVGLEFERKGGYILLDAWKKVQATMPEAQLWIVGPRKPLADPIPGVHWKGRIFDRDMLNWMFQQSRVFVLPSLFEPFAMAMLEAMGMGLPCIGTDAFGTQEMIKSGVNGLLVKTGDASELADALLTLRQNPDLAKKMGTQAHTRVLEKFTWANVVSRMVPQIEQVTGLKI